MTDTLTTILTGIRAGAEQGLAALGAPIAPAPQPTAPTAGVSIARPGLWGRGDYAGQLAFTGGDLQGEGDIYFLRSANGSGLTPLYNFGGWANNGLDIPEGATVRGITLHMDRAYIGAAPSMAIDTVCRLCIPEIPDAMPGAVLRSENRAKAEPWACTTWSAPTAQHAVYGGPADLWGLGAITVAQVERLGVEWQALVARPPQPNQPRDSAIMLDYVQVAVAYEV